jgi:hypothetical protein
LSLIKRNILESPFISDDLKNKIFSIFSTTQRQYLILNKFIYICKFKQASFYESDNDLFCNPLDQFPNSQKVIILHKKRKYIFRLTDLMNSWKNSLTHSEELFPSMQDFRNPYTNIPFKKSNLYNIYFALYFSPLQIHFLIQEYFNINFSQKYFCIKFSSVLKDIAIQNFIETTNNTELVDDIKEMCNKYYNGDNDVDFSINFNERFKIIKTMKEYLYIYYLSEYSQNKKVKRLSINFLNKEFKQFILANIPLNGEFFKQRTLLKARKKEVYIFKKLLF